MSIRISVASASEIIAKSLFEALAQIPEFDLVGYFISRENWEKELKANPGIANPDIEIINSQRLNAQGIIETVHDFHQRNPRTKIIIFLPPEQASVIPMIVNNGVRAILNLNTCIQDIIKAIFLVNSGYFILAPSLDEGFFSAKSQNDNYHLIYNEIRNLSSREKEIFLLLLQGKTNKQIAEKLLLSPFTIRGHVSNILHKLHFNSRYDVSFWGVKHNITEEIVNL